MGNLKSEMKESMNSVKFAAKVSGEMTSEAAKEMVNAASYMGKKTIDAAKDMKDAIKSEIE